ncbi:MAG TPA: M56 family metallopeptidase [Armatimonadota bacterium]|nr:M56 family metallopeptidase [Armatimonadota bacterium]
MWRASWQGGLLVLVAWSACRIFPRLPAAYRCWLWWLACLRLAIGLLTVPPLTLALLPAPATSPVPPLSVAVTPPSATVSAPPAPSTPAPTLTTLLLMCWMAGMLLHGVSISRALLLIKRLRQEARPVEEGWLREEGARLSRRAGLRRPLPILISAAAGSPMLVGPFAPALLLPSAVAERFPEVELQLALAHEIAHARRRDLWLSIIPGLVQALFFFHPLARLACREWALAREAACDGEVLQLTEAGPAEYGRLLLRLVAGPVPAGALSATPTYRSLERRLCMLRDYAPMNRRLAATGAFLTALVATGLLPWQLTAQAAPDATTTALTRPEGPRITGEVTLPRGGPRRIPAATINRKQKQKPQVLRRLAIHGATAFTQDEIRKVLKTRVGEAFDAQRWEADRTAVSRLYQDQGYQVRLSSEGPEKGHLTLTLQELRVGTVQLKWLQPGLEGHAELVLSKLQQKTGVLYNVNQLRKDFRAMNDLNLFEAINPAVEVDEELKVAITWEFGKQQ